MNEGFYSTSDLCERYGVTSRTLENWRKTRGFPTALMLGGKGSKNRYDVEDVKKWELEQKAAA